MIRQLKQYRIEAVDFQGNNVDSVLADGLSFYEAVEYALDNQLFNLPPDFVGHAVYLHPSKVALRLEIGKWQ
jgi:hypothetical protein